jgi:hypothetical protein
MPAFAPSPKLAPEESEGDDAEDAADAEVLAEAGTLAEVEVLVDVVVVNVLLLVVDDKALEVEDPGPTAPPIVVTFTKSPR